MVIMAFWGDFWANKVNGIQDNYFGTLLGTSLMDVKRILGQFPLKLVLSSILFGSLLAHRGRALR